MNEELMQLGMAARQSGNREAALRYFEEVIQKYPDCFNAYVEAGVELLDFDRISEAKKRFQLALNKDKNNTQALLGLGECFQKEMRQLEALKVFSIGIKEQAHEQRFYDKASQAFLSCLLPTFQETIQGDDFKGEFNKDELIEQLILQEKCLDSSSQFVRVLADFYFQQNDESILKIVSQELLPVLKKLYKNNRINKNLVLALIFLREFIANSISSKNVSKLHKQYFYEFSSEDIKLPYNLLKGRPFWKNKRDLKQLSASLDSCLDTTTKLELYHLLLLAWNNENLLKFLHNSETLLNILKIELISRSEISQEAGRSLLLRYFNEDMTRDMSYLSPILDNLSSTTEYLKLLEETRIKRIYLMQTRTEPGSNILKPFMQTKVYQGLNVLNHLMQTKIHRGWSNSKKLRVAVCVSGQLRGFRQAFSSWTDKLLFNTEYDLFVHTWKRIGRSEPTPFRAYNVFEGKQFLKTYTDCCSLIGYEKMKPRYASLFKYTEQSGNITKEEISEIYKTTYVVVDDEEEEQFCKFSNQDKMHYKIYACHQYMLSQGKEYDLYIRIRPDKPISLIGFNWQDIYRRCKTEPLIFADHELGTHFGHPVIGDQFAVGDFNIMSLYSDTWKFNPIASSQGLLNWPKHFTGHVSLAQTCWIHGIDVEKIPIRWSALLDPEALPLELVLEKVRLDASDRMDKFDRQLINALEMDLAAG